MKIFRAPLAITDKQVFVAHKLGKILSVADSRDAPGQLLDLWYESGASFRDDAEITITILGTGKEAGFVDGDFVGTVVAANQLVWHVYASVIRI